MEPTKTVAAVDDLNAAYEQWAQAQKRWIEAVLADVSTRTEGNPNDTEQ